MTSEEDKDLEATYGPTAPFSEHHRGDHITYTSAEGVPDAGGIAWVRAASIAGNKRMGVRYVVIQGEPAGFGFNIVWPADVIS